VAVNGPTHQDSAPACCALFETGVHIHEYTLAGACVSCLPVRDCGNKKGQSMTDHAPTPASSAPASHTLAGEVKSEVRERGLVGLPGGVTIRNVAATVSRPRNRAIVDPQLRSCFQGSV
jgi:hypothetical protein